MKHHLNILTCILTVAVLFNSCKDGAPGPEGPKGNNGTLAEWQTKEGYIKSTVNTTTTDGTHYSWNISFTGEHDQSHTGYSDSEGKKLITIEKRFAGEGEDFIKGALSFSFTVSSLEIPDSPVMTSFRFSAEKKTGENTVYKTTRSFYSDDNSGKGAVSNLIYDKGTGTISGNFTLSLPSQSENTSVHPTRYESGSIEFIKGTFSSRIVKVVQ